MHDLTPNITYNVCVYVHEYKTLVFRADHDKVISFSSLSVDINLLHSLM